MVYSNYKYCLDENFTNLKERLNLLKNKIVSNSENLEEFTRLEDKDYLNLGFTIKDQKPFHGSFYILYKDVPEQALFDIGVFKSYDIDKKRYFKRTLLEISISLNKIETNYLLLVQKGLAKYISWKKEDLLAHIEIATEQ